MAKTKLRAKIGLVWVAFSAGKKCLSEASCFFQKKKPPTSGQPLKHQAKEASQ